MKAVCVFTGKEDILNAVKRINAFTSELLGKGIQVEVWLLGEYFKMVNFVKGANCIVHCPLDNDPLPENLLDNLEALYKERKPELLFFSDLYSTLATRLSYRIKGVCYTSCKSIGINENEIWIRRKVYNSNADAIYRHKHSPIVITVSKSGILLEDIGNAQSVPIIEIKPIIKHYNYCKNRNLNEKKEKNPLEEAKFVLVCGRGIGSKENYEKVERLAKHWGGACGCTRAVAINGWSDVSNIIGQSGQVIRAELCITLGVSGAAPFMSGIENVKKLVAINTDSDAQIFKGADYGILGDAIKVLEYWEKQLGENMYED